MAQSKMTDSKFTEGDRPLLKKWGKVATSRVFAVNSFVNANIKKTLLQVMEAIRYSVNPQVCMLQQNMPELLCYLPYLLGFACEAGYFHQIQVDIRKPILMVSNTTTDANHLMETISAPIAPKSHLLQLKQILTDSEIVSGAQYRSHMITASDSVNYANRDIKYEVIVCTTDCLPHLSHRDFSLVIGQETRDPALTGFQMFCSVILLKYSSNASNTLSSLTGSSGPCLAHYSDMIATKQCPMPQILEPQIRGIEEMIDRVTDFSCSHIPIELNICGENGLKELVCALPSLLGSAANCNSVCLDLSKPVLFLTTDLAAYKLVSGVLPVILPMECNETTAPDLKELMYKCCLLKNEFEVCTFSHQINHSEIVLTSTEFAKEKSGMGTVANNYYKNFQSFNLSAVVIVQTQYLPNNKEQDIVYHFRGVTTILIRANAETEKNDKEGHIKVVPKILTVQKCSAELISPTLMTHGSDITERFLLSQKSILTYYQQVGLANIVEWLGSSSSSNGRVVHVTTAIGFKYAAMMLWCLPSMLEWADQNQLIPDGAINLKNPLLVLCTNQETLLNIWNMVHSKNPFHQTALLRSVNTCSDGKSLSYLAADVKSAVNTGNIVGQYKLILSDISLLDQLPETAFSEIVVFQEDQMSKDAMNLVKEKYANKSKIVYFTSHQVGPMKKFDLHDDNEFQGNQNQEALEGQIKNAVANETFVTAEPLEKSEPKESNFAGKILMEKPATFSDNEQVKKLMEKPIEKPVTSDDNNSLKKQIEKPIEKPVTSADNNSLKKQIEKPIEKPVTSADNNSLKKQIEKPIEKPVTSADNNSLKKQIAKPIEKPVTSADNKQLKKPIQTPIEKQLPMYQVSQNEKYLEGDSVDANITTMPPDLVAMKSDLENADENHCNDGQEGITLISEAVANTTSLPEKKKKTKLLKIIKKKIKTHNTPQQNASSIHPSSDEIVFTDITSSHLEAQEDCDTNTQLKKTSNWSKCKKFLLRRFSPKKRKTRRQRNSPSRDSRSASGPFDDIAEHTGDDHHSTGLFMCWRMRRLENRRGAPRGGQSTPGPVVHSTLQGDQSTLKPSHSTPKCDDSTPSVHSCENTEEIADNHSDVMTWTDPVTYLTNRYVIPNACPVDMPEENLKVDAISFCLSEPSSIDIISLTERDNSVVNNASSSANPLDMNKVDKMKAEPNSDLQDMPCATTASYVPHLEIQNVPLASPSRSESHLDLQDISYSNSSSYESIESLLNTIEREDAGNQFKIDNFINCQPKTPTQI